MAVNDRLNITAVPTEVIWKWQQYGKNFIAVFPLFPSRRKCFLIYLLTIQWQAVEQYVIWTKCITSSFNPFQDRLFRGCSWMGGGGRGQEAPIAKICPTCPTIMKLGAVIPYLKKIRKLYESCDTRLEFCWHQHFLLEISKFCSIKKYRYRFHLDT